MTDSDKLLKIHSMIDTIPTWTGGVGISFSCLNFRFLILSSYLCLKNDVLNWSTFIDDLFYSEDLYQHFSRDGGFSFINTTRCFKCVNPSHYGSIERRKSSRSNIKVTPEITMLLSRNVQFPNNTSQQKHVALLSTLL